MIPLLPVRNAVAAGLAALTLLAIAPTDAEARRSKNPLVNLSIKDADVRQVLAFLAREGRMNVVMSESVSGKVSLYLKGVRLKSALRAVMHAAGLDSMRQGGIIVVMTRQEVMKHLDARRARFEAYPPPPRILP